ncbi:Cytidylate kinase [Buchnera aphidicola (Anoecia corni)]|uniref:Cytidylate kinase n=1 Tax=Buchnera aphidicola (Anoecia corni) TaxID=2994477 RepID=A0AAT9IGB8_9GAMM
MNIPVITIDGTSASGKSTLCKKISKKIGWFSLESGFIYRAVALIYLQRSSYIIPNKVIVIAKKLNYFLFIRKKKFKVIYNKKDITNNIFTEKTSILASKISQIPEIRSILLNVQKSFRLNPGLVANGRDMGTVVFPDSQLKFFLTSNLKIRSYRRMLQLRKRGIITSFKKTYYEIQKRDNLDIFRKISPLKPSKNAIILDTSYINTTEMFNISMKYVKSKFNL